MPDFNVSTALPDLTLREQSIITVDTGDASATITSLVIHVAQGAPLGAEDGPQIPLLFPELTYGPEATSAA